MYHLKKIADILEVVKLHFNKKLITMKRNNTEGGTFRKFVHIK